MQLGGAEMTWLGHAAIRIRLGDGTTVLVDPWLTGNPACPDEERNPDRADAIFVTHGHFDHMGAMGGTVDVVEIARRTGAQVFAIHEIAVWLESQGLENVVGLNMGCTVAAPGGIWASMVPAVHSSGMSGDQGIVDGGVPAGWVLDLPDGPTIHHAGDTTVFGDMALTGELFTPDVALLPIGGHFTMGPRLAAKAAALLGVETVMPIHYGTFPILAGTPDQLREHAAGSFEVVAPEPGETVS